MEKLRSQLTAMQTEAEKLMSWVNDLQAYNLRLSEALRWVLRHTKLLIRWPCTECGRTGLTEPFKMVRGIRDDGTETWSGCHACNMDPLIAHVEEVLDSDPSIRRGRK